MLGIGLVFNLVLVIALCALVRVRNWFNGLQYNIGVEFFIISIGKWFGFHCGIGNHILCVG